MFAGKALSVKHFLNFNRIATRWKRHWGSGCDYPLELGFYGIGRMKLYRGYFAAEENSEGDAEPVGIILSRHKDELLIEYATYGMNSQLIVLQYQLYHPNREELRRELGQTLLLGNGELKVEGRR